MRQAGHIAGSVRRRFNVVGGAALLWRGRCCSALAWAVLLCSGVGVGGFHMVVAVDGVVRAKQEASM